MFRPGLAIVLAMLAAPAGAEIYKWTDAQGKVHYADQPPSSSPPQPFNPRTAKDAEARAEQARRQAADQAARKRMEQDIAREAAAASEAEARRKAENCQRARGNLETLQRSYKRITKVDAQGQAQILDEAGREEEVQRAVRAIAENCPN
jgi:hypothetical protein